MAAPPLTPAELALYPQSKQHAMVASLVLFLVLANSSVALRLLSQWRLHKRAFAEDYFVLFSVACADVVMATYLTGVHHGLGLHIFRIAADDPHLPNQLVIVFETLWLPAVFNGPCMLSVKLSLLLFYRRIFLVNQTWLRRVWWANIIYAVLWAVGSTLFYIFQCSPVSFYWERIYARYGVVPPHPINGECSSTSVGHIAIPLILSLISDVAILCLPLFALSNLQMSKKRKIGLFALFSFGALACVCELVRVIVIEVDTDDAQDPTYDTVTFIIMTCAAEAIAIMCACIPLIASQVAYVSEKIRSSRRSQATGFSGKPIRLTEESWRTPGSTNQKSTSSQEQLYNEQHSATRRPSDINHSNSEMTLGQMKV